MTPDGAPSGLPVGDLPLHGPWTVDLPVPGVALAVGAHPDDVEFGCGATLAKWAAAGAAVHHLVLTDGSKGTWDGEEDSAALVATRRREQEEAAALLGGGGVDFLEWPDGELESDLPQRRQVAEVIRRVRPDVVLGHDPWRRYRLHPDHRHAGWLVTDAVVAARDPKFFPDLALSPHRPRALLLWEADEPNHLETVEGFADRKVAALLAHRSQYPSTFGIGAAGDGAGDLGEKVRRQLAAHGARAGLPPGEAFRLLDDL